MVPCKDEAVDRRIGIAEGELTKLVLEEFNSMNADIEDMFTKKAML